MANQGYFRLEAKVLSRSKGHAMTPAYAYRTASKQRDDETGKIYDFTRKRDVYLCEMMSPANAPEWVSDRQRLWAEVEKVERRKDSQLAREIVLCFPNCLTNDEKVAVTRDYVQKEFVWRGMVADIAYHSFQGKYKNNPHAHVLLTMRSINEKGFGQKNRDWNSDALLENWREQWAHHLNKYLERGGYEIRVDHRSYEAQGIDRAPTLHEGRAATQKRRRGASTSVTERNDDIKQVNADMERAQAELRNEQAKEAWKQKHREERIARREAQKQHLAQEQDNTPDAKQADIKHLAAQTREVIAPTLVRQSKTEATSPQLTMKDEPQPATSAPTSTESKPEREQQQRGGGGDGTEPPQPPRTMKYLTWHNVNRQLSAMGGDGRFDIGIGTRNEETEKIERMESLRQQWQNNGFLTKAEILKYDPKTGKTPIIDALKGENANGKEIFIRLAPTAEGKQQGVFLVDDIEEVTIEDLKSKGITPAVVVETSHKNCQAWIRVSREAVEKEAATQLARLLTKEYGGDPASASYQHYGRLVGFTNRKEKHRHAYTGKYPYVKLVESTGLYTPNGEQWVERARAAAAIEREKIEKAAAVREQLSNHPATQYQQQRALKMFDSLFDRFWQRRTSNDYSKTDWAVLKHMIKRLGYSNEDALRHALRHGSPDLAKRKAGHTEDYVDRTIKKLLQQPDVLEAIAQRQQRHQAKVQQAVSQPQIAESVQAPASKEKDLDQRKVIEQWQQIKDAGKERTKGGADAVSQPRRQPEDGRHRDNSRPASGNAPDKDIPATPSVPHSGDTRSIKTHLSKSTKAPLHNSSYFQWLQAQKNPHQHHDPEIDPSTAHLPPANLEAEAVGDLDAASVAAVIQTAHTSKNSAQQLRMAAWAYHKFQKDEGTWNKCKLEYLRELYRRQRALGKDGVLHPNTDVEIALRLRMAGFSNTQIYNVIRATSPLTISLPSVDHQNIYLKKAIYPYLNNGKALTAAKNFENERRRQAAKLPPEQQQAYLQERRLDKLGLATPVPPPEPSPQRNRRPSPESPGSQPPKGRDDQQRER